MVTVDVKGEGTHEIDLESLSSSDSDAALADGTPAAHADAGAGADAPTPTYADLLSALELSPHEVSVLVDGRPVPEDQPVETDHVTVLRLIKGG